MLELILECFFAWKIQFNSEIYQTICKNLQDFGIQFPEKFYYFQKEELKSKDSLIKYTSYSVEDTQNSLRTFGNKFLKLNF